MNLFFFKFAFFFWFFSHYFSIKLKIIFFRSPCASHSFSKSRTRWKPWTSWNNAMCSAHGQWRTPIWSMWSKRFLLGNFYLSTFLVLHKPRGLLHFGVREDLPGVPGAGHDVQEVGLWGMGNFEFFNLKKLIVFYEIQIFNNVFNYF